MECFDPSTSVHYPHHEEYTGRGYCTRCGETTDEDLHARWKLTGPDRPRNGEQAKRAGLVCVGEWWGNGGPCNGVWCLPSDRSAVQEAYDAIREGDLGPNVLADVIEAGGILIPD